MRMYDVCESLSEMLDCAQSDKEQAYSLLATAEYLIGWLYKYSILHGVSEYPLKEKLRDIRRGFRHACQLLCEEETTRNPFSDASSALNCLSCNTMIGSIDGLLFKHIDE